MTSKIPINSDEDKVLESSWEDGSYFYLVDAIQKLSEATCLDETIAIVRTTEVDPID